MSHTLIPPATNWMAKAANGGGASMRGNRTDEEQGPHDDALGTIVTRPNMVASPSPTGTA